PRRTRWRPRATPPRCRRCPSERPRAHSSEAPPSLSLPVFETPADRLHGRVPEPAFVLRGPLVEAAERAVAERLPPRPRVSVLGPFDRRLALRRHHDPRQPRPGEVLRPRRMVVLGIDRGRDLVRSSFPQLMPDDGRSRPASGPLLARLGVSAVTVHDEDP